MLEKQFRGPAANALCDTIQKQTNEADAIKHNGKSDASQNSWKSHEASIVEFGILKNIILKKQMAGTLSLTSQLSSVTLFWWICKILVMQDGLRAMKIHLIHQFRLKLYEM